MDKGKLLTMIKTAKGNIMKHWYQISVSRRNAEIAYLTRTIYRNMREV